MSSERFGLCCIGAGGHGRTVALQWEARNGSKVVFADEHVRRDPMVGKIPVRFNRLAEIEDIPVIVTVGDNDARARLQNEAQTAGLEVASFLADPANYFGIPAGEGTVILAGVVVNAGARI